MYLFIDTETTGLPDDFNSLSSYSNVRLVQIAYIIYDNYGNKIYQRDFIIKPEGFEIPENSTKIHKISNSIALIAGKSLKKVLFDLNDKINRCSFIVAHNLNFDYNVLLSELNRADITTKIHSLTKICTMKSTTDYCSISTSKGYKWPSLAELYKKIFLEEMKEAHNAAKDIEATAKCFWYLKKHKLVNFVEIEKYDSINVKNFKVSKLINLEDTIF
jgi:DNA polymerase III epsilon subunit-like protein